MASGKTTKGKRPSVVKNFMYNSAYQLLRILLPLISAPYLSRVLGSTEIGVYSYTYTIARYFTLVAMLGMEKYGSRAIARVRDDDQERSRTFWNLYYLELIVSLVVVGAYAAYALFISNQHMRITLIWGLWVLSACFDINWYFFGVERFKITVTRNFIIKLLSFAALFLFVKSEADTWIYCLITALSFVFQQLAVWPFMKEEVSWYPPHAREIFAHFKPCLALFIPVIAINLYTSLDKVLLGMLSTMGEVGLYEYAERVIGVPTSVIAAFGTVMLPRMSNMLSHPGAAPALEDGKVHSQTLATSIWFSLLMALGFAFGIAGVSHELAVVYFGPGFEGSGILLAILAATIPLIALSNAVGIQYLLPRGQDSLYTAAVAAGAVSNVAINMLITRNLAAVGASIATVAAELAVVLFQYAKLRRELAYASYVKAAFPYALIGAAMCVAVRCIGAALGPRASTLLIQVASGIVLYVAGSFLYAKLSHDTRFEALLGAIKASF